MNLPTKITVSRLALVLLLILGLFLASLFPEAMSYTLGDSGILLTNLVAGIVFLIASLTDFLDGYLARKRNEVTDLGKFLDPIADKVLVDSALIYLAIPNPYQPGAVRIHFLCLILMIGRDLVVDALRQVAASKGVVLAANWMGKAKTVLQMAAIVLLFLNGWPFSYFDAGWPMWLHLTDFLVYLATAASVLSGAVYLWQNRRALGARKEG